jgi:predicted RNase H-like nuclease
MHNHACDGTDTSQGAATMPPVILGAARAIRVLGIDLAWGERRPDGVCLIEARRRAAYAHAPALVRGDAALLAWIAEAADSSPALLAVDAPLVCPNTTGARPVDRETHVQFGRYKCGCHPSNATLHPRPPRLGRALRAMGYRLDWTLNVPRTAAEVYPHPALVRLLGLDERIPYKRGPVAARRVAFSALQTGLLACLARHFPRLELAPDTRRLLTLAWTKDVEDRTDGFICALIGYWHWLHHGRRSQTLGNLATGFLLVPAP